ncbi:MAG: 50S ribosome-binding GTPase [Ignavibacteriaceae bacterium]
MQIGIVGLPQSGKSTLFQTITKTHLDLSSMMKVTFIIDDRSR